MSTILLPVFTLIAWSLFMWLCLYATRLPAMSAANIDPQTAAHPGSLIMLPSKTRQIADNYNHLHEQPTIFYALAFLAYLLGQNNEINIYLAWAYVAARVVHTIIQCSVNIVVARFATFAISSLCLVALTVRIGISL